jgi:hypothetical protein
METRKATKQTESHTYRLSDDHRARVGRRDPRYELVRAPGERERLAVVALRLPLGIQADDGDDGVRLPRELHGRGDQRLAVLYFDASEPDARVAVGVNEFVNKELLCDSFRRDNDEPVEDIFVLVAICWSANVAELNEDIMLNPRLQLISS